MQNNLYKNRSIYKLYDNTPQYFFCNSPKYFQISYYFFVSSLSYISESISLHSVDFF